MTDIIKRDGSIEEYRPLKIAHTLKKTVDTRNIDNFSEDDTYEVVYNVTSKVKGLERQKRPITTSMVLSLIIDELNRKGFTDVAKYYNKYEAEKDLKEEGKKEILQKLYLLTNSDSDDLDIKRENANVEGDTPMGTMLQLGTEISKELARKYLVPKEAMEYMDNNLIHIHDLDFWASQNTTTCLQIPLDKLLDEGFSSGEGSVKSPKRISVAAELSAIALQANQNNQHGGQAFARFDFDLAPYVALTFIDELIKYLEYDENKDIEKIKKELFKLYKDENRHILHDKALERVKDICDINDYIVKKTIERTEKEVHQAMQGLVHNLNSMNSRSGSQVPFSSINFGLDTSKEGRMISRNLLLAQEKGLGNGETAIFPILIFKVKEGINYNEDDPNFDLFKLSTRVSSKRMFPNYVFVDAPFNLEHFNPNKPEDAVATMGCRTRVLANINGESTPVGRGNLSFTSVNLVKIALNNTFKIGDYEHVDIEGFYNDLEETMVVVREQLLKRYDGQKKKQVKNFPFLMGEGCARGSEDLDYNDTIEDALKHGTLSIGFIGLAETLTVLTGKHHGESEESQKLGLEIISFMRDLTDKWTNEYSLNFSIIATPAEGLSGRFVKNDKMEFGIIENITDKDYYTNSFHVPVGYDISINDKINIEAPYHALTNGGHITYIELDGDPSKNLDAFMSIIRAMKEAGVGYGAINFPMDYDPVCDYRGVIDGNICPKCGRDESKSDIKYQRIRRITGYLVGTVDRFNDAKRAEEKDRVKHRQV